MSSTRNPIIIPCPKCGAQGWIDKYHPRNSRKNPSYTEYCIVHEGLGYDWGTRRETKTEAKRRCYMIKPHWRTQVINRLKPLA